MEYFDSYPLDSHALAPALAKATGRKRCRITNIAFDPRLQITIGYGATKAVPTVEYEDADGRTRSIVMFVKWQNNEHYCERVHYEHLVRLGAPVPRLYDARQVEGRELLFLECLNCAEAPIVDEELVAMTARLNAVSPDAAYAVSLGERAFGRELAEAKQTVNEIHARALAGELGDNLQRYCQGLPGLPASLSVLADHLAAPVSRMETGLVHTDLYPENCGHRGGGGELLVFDLVFMSFGPRFYDVARWVGTSAGRNDTNASDLRLARAYLDAYSRAGGTAPALEQFLGECSVLKAVSIFVMLWFKLARSLDGKVDWTDDVDEGREVTRRKLQRDLGILMEYVER